MTGLFDATFARGGAAVAVSDAGWFDALLDAEAALARAAASVGLVPTTAADAVTAVCAEPSRLNLATVIKHSADAGNPVPPLVRELQAAVGEQDAVAVHVGATSQDMLDTALMLLARRALAAIRTELAAAADAAAALAEAHRDDVVMGRTLMQQALPTTFGLTAAGWLAGLDGAQARLHAVDVELPVQYGGAVGTLAASGGAGIELRDAFAAELGLTSTPVAWHTTRLPIADLAGALGATAGVLATIALDVVLLAQTEVAEVSEGGPDERGGSSAMPHKRNPVAAISARACARRAPGLAATLFGAMEQEHERSAGAWHSEWPTLTELLSTVGSAAAWLTECLSGLRPDPVRMAATVAASRDPELAGAFADALTPTLGPAAAHDAAAEAVREAATTGRPLADVLADHEDVDLPPLGIPDVGEAGAQVDAALAAHALATGRMP
jgi:3-carboxy-cis,cis-muconate cycloisomerase